MLGPRGIQRSFFNLSCPKLPPVTIIVSRSPAVAIWFGRVQDFYGLLSSSPPGAQHPLRQGSSFSIICFSSTPYISSPSWMSLALTDISGKPFKLPNE